MPNRCICQLAADQTGFTTKRIEKIRGIGINDMVISVNKLPDGTAGAAIADASSSCQ
jgi:hypothetical protein